MGGEKIIWGGAFAPPWRRHWSVTFCGPVNFIHWDISFNKDGVNCFDDLGQLFSHRLWLGPLKNNFMHFK